MSLLLTNRDSDLIQILASRVRVLSIDQVARTWWADSRNAKAAAERRLRMLSEQGLIQMERAMAHPEIQLDAPVIVWEPSAPSPDFGKASYQLQSRWCDSPVRTLCVSASELAARRHGGFCTRLPRAVELTHDIHLSQVFLTYRSRHPELIKHWVFEEQIKSERRRSPSRPGEKLPDVVLRLGTGRRVIEFGGAYGKEKLKAFHDYCLHNSLPYEVW